MRLLLINALPFRKLHFPKTKQPGTKPGVFILVDTLSENWNQLETYIFDAYEMIKGLNIANVNNELAA